MSEKSAVEYDERGQVRQERPKRLARRDDAAAQMMLSRALGDELPQLDVAMFNSSI